MAVIGVHTSHELYAPSALKQLRQAERAVFQASRCAGHFHQGDLDLGFDAV